LHYECKFSLSGVNQAKQHCIGNDPHIIDEASANKQAVHRSGVHIIIGQNNNNNKDVRAKLHIMAAIS
jgi:hypothetical protein